MTDYRKAKNISRREAAKRIGISHLSLARFEQGREIKSTQWAKLLTWIFSE